MQRKEKLLPAFVWGTGICLNFLLFNIIWCIYTTFTPFSHIELYLSTFLSTMVLLLPYLLKRWWKLELVLMIMLNLWFITNLMYYRTYFTAIPPTSYFLAGNLADFMQSVYDSFRVYDLLFPLITVLTLICFQRSRKKELPVVSSRSIARYFGIMTLLAVALVADNKMKGGFVKSYSQLKLSAHLYSSGVPMYSLFGHLYYELSQNKSEYTDEVKNEIQTWLDNRPAMKPLALTEGQKRKNCILIFAESLESWVIGLNYQGHEITPYLNKLLKDSTTLYAPKVLTQVKGGRSIDAQLMICAGMLPLKTGTYSVDYPDNLYYSLQKAMKEQNNSRNYLLTVDKIRTWNQGVIANAFGVDTILSYNDFELREAFGNRKRAGDCSLMEQAVEKMQNKEIWKDGENVYMQLVTYSGHAPFLLPESLRSYSLTGDVPTMMEDYMVTATYTDKSFEILIEYLKTRPDFDDTMIVITGDHEGLASHRSSLCSSKAGKGVISEKQYTPLIIINSPVGMHYDKVMGQIDIYPTLINLLQLDNYRWTGMGQSILDDAKLPVAVGSVMNVEQEVADETTVERLKKAHDISDKMLKFDYFSHQ